jgi:hypothetical protein
MEPLGKQNVKTLIQCSKFLNSKDCDAIYPGTVQSLAGHYIEMSGKEVTAEGVANQDDIWKKITGGLKDYLLRIALTGRQVLFYSTLKG